jgi:hypothetical protein
MHKKNNTIYLYISYNNIRNTFFQNFTVNKLNNKKILTENLLN